MRGRNFLRGAAAVLLCAFLLAPGRAPAQEALPGRTAAGYLDARGVAEEFVLADAKGGHWLYLSPDLQVEIRRCEDSSVPLIWFEADIKTKGEQLLHGVLASPDRPGRKNELPETIARRNRLVFAVNDDYFCDRAKRGLTQGIIVRDGEILNDTTYPSGTRGFPSLEAMALFPDGNLMVYGSAEHTAQEYLDMGAVDVFAFGPILIRDGEMNPELIRRNRSLEPRCCLGMAEPFHYVCILAEGRRKDSRGTGLEWVARRMREMGVTQALNLDGGQTAAMAFMGDRINATGKFKTRFSVRSLSGMIGVGVSPSVPEK